MQGNADGDDDSEEEGRTRSQAAAAAAEFEEDGNTDLCVLCGLGGSLLCCDGCPAAYHMRCIGESAKSIPPGEWLCPECSVGGRGMRPLRHLWVGALGLSYCTLTDSGSTSSAAGGGALRINDNQYVYYR